MLALAKRTIAGKDGWADGIGIGIAGLCLVHCLATAIFFAFVAAAGGFLFDPRIHEYGLLLAIIFGVLALGQGFWRHGYIMPAIIGAIGIGVLGGALLLPHGGTELFWTMIGASLLVLGHVLNLRASQ